MLVSRSVPRSGWPARAGAARFATFDDKRSLEKRLPLRVPHDARGTNLLHDPLWNKGTNFSISERGMLAVTFAS